ncbi:GNAT family N-acetyltransferase [Streptomyces buecherae]|uniref:GNAT family N-acetyltransferase n=1 Tax=Streptomyces buecherae TaxID=2763006 RepID=UPI0036C41F27
MELKRYGKSDVGNVRSVLLDVHSACYAEETDAFHSRDSFSGFVDRWSANDEWSCLVAYENAEAIGLAYGAPFSRGAWWRGSEAPREMAATDRAFALSELMVVPTWRKKGIALRLHDALLYGREEELVTLFVDSSHPRVQALYETWGYRKVGESKPYDDSPTFAVMVKRLRP